ncbi:hypothetical protein CKO_00741 [Citrobacter koseri ATCC BAA-895]|uniref:Uncharacterized protein n=1 Tax=Citrobacter koseri (strain ATCC BAA-895 / CDC 4225-83 / SGSC4696) TaxID=290338 RepID=A8AEH9_CITK8|nr:hypothetical protein CKO_00741 [Citrobacter koseri ATCC BAA-895]
MRCRHGCRRCGCPGSVISYLPLKIVAGWRLSPYPAYSKINS